MSPLSTFCTFPDSRSRLRSRMVMCASRTAFPIADEGSLSEKRWYGTIRPTSGNGAPLPTLVKTHVVTDTGLGEAYFGGNLVPVYAGFHRATGGKLNLAAFAERLNPPNASTAAAVLEDAADKHAWTSS